VATGEIALDAISAAEKYRRPPPIVLNANLWAVALGSKLSAEATVRAFGLQPLPEPDQVDILGQPGVLVLRETLGEGPFQMADGVRWLGAYPPIFMHSSHSRRCGCNSF